METCKVYSLDRVQFQQIDFFNVNILLCDKAAICAFGLDRCRVSSNRTVTTFHQEGRDFSINRFHCLDYFLQSYKNIICHYGFIRPFYAMIGQDRML